MAYKPLENDLPLPGEGEERDETQTQMSEDEKEGFLSSPVPLLSQPSSSSSKSPATSVLVHAGQGKRFQVFRYAMAVGAFVLLFAFLTAAIVLVALAPPCNAVPKDSLVWWKTTVIYQCYPRSFKDTTGDGNGDLQGIREKLDYLHDLGINALWLNPIFESPQKDNGYDVSNYTAVDPLYGSMDDLKELLHDVYSRGMHLILDFVPNHTSEEHPWFKDSRSSIHSAKRDWYVWSNASTDGGPPNNWISVFGGPAWSWDNTTSQYYLHQFSTFQPDLNYRNPDVQKAMEDVLKFWFDFGVDGFRIDAVSHLLEDPLLRNESLKPHFNSSINCTGNCYDSLIHNRTKDYPGIHDIIRKWRKIADNYTDRFFVGEVYDPVDVVMTYYGENNDEFHFPFNFFLLSNHNWTGDGVHEAVSSWMDALPEGAWPNWVLGNHDNPRIASKVGNYLARAVNVLLLTLPGTPTTYYGEEIFMTDVSIPPDKQRDEYGDRDQERTPMQWSDEAYAGFSKGGVKPWLPVSDNYSMYNVRNESANSSSMLALYKRLVNLVTLNEAFQFAEYAPLMSNQDIFAYQRYHNGTVDRFIVVVNFSPTNTTANLTLPEEPFLNPKLELSSVDSSRDDGSVDLQRIPLAGGEAVVISGSDRTSSYDTDC